MYTIAVVYVSLTVCHIQHVTAYTCTQGNTIQATKVYNNPVVLMSHQCSHSHPCLASCVVSSSRALSGSILLANHKDLKDVSLDSVRMLLLDDGANPCKFHCALPFICVKKCF